MQKIWRHRLIVLGVVSASLCAAFFLAWQYATSYARRELQSQLRALSKGPVEVDDVKLGWRQIIAIDIRVIDVLNGEPWLQVERLVADVGLWDAIFGTTTAKQVIADRGTLILRFDRDGNLLTRVPAGPLDERLPLDSLVLRDASLTLDQDGSAPWLVTQIDGTLDATEAGFEASATIGDALGSKWKLFASSGAELNATISTSRLQLSGELLAQLPQTPAAVAEIEQIAASVNIQLHMNEATDGELKRRVNVKLTSLEANVPAADVDLQDGSAEIVIENRRIHVNSLKGNIAGGRVALACEMDLVEKSGSLTGSIYGMSLAGLPASWGIPQRITGQLEGEANLQIDSSGDAIFLAGTTRGVIADAKIEHLAIEPVEIEMELDRRPFGDKPSGRLRVGLAVSQLDLRELLKTLEPTAGELAEHPRGKLTGKIELTAPLDALADPARYEGTGDVHSTQIDAGQVTVRDVATNIVIEQGMLSLDKVNCKLAGGVLRGGVVAEMNSGNTVANFTLDGLSLGELARLTTSFPDAIRGAVDGTIELSGSWKQLAELADWAAKGQLESDRIEIQDEVLIDTSTAMRLEKGFLRLDDIRAVWTNTEIRGDASLSLHSPHTFAAHVAAREISLEKVVHRFDELPELRSLRGAATINANLSGTLIPLQWRAEGDGKCEAVMLDSWSIDKSDVQWELDEHSLHITQLNMDAYGGKLKSTASLPFDSESIEVEGTFRDVMTESLPRLTETNVKLFGPASGSFSVIKPKTGDNLVARVEFRGPTLSAHSVDLTELAGNGSYDDGGLQMKVSGNALGGMVSVNGTGAVSESDFADLAFEGKIHAEQIDLSALSALSASPQVRELQGTGNADLDFEISGLSATPTGSGTVSLERLRWKDVDLASSASASITLLADALMVRDLSARMSEGTATGEITVPLTGERSGIFRLNLARVSSRRLLALWPSLTRAIDGNLDLRLEGRVDRRWYGTGQMRMSRAQVAGIPIQRFRAPVAWTFAPDSNRLQLSSHDATVHVGRGRVTTDVELTLGRRRLDIKCDGRAQAIDIKTLLKKAPVASRSVDGALTGDFRIEGRDVRSPDDLTGRYNAKVIRSQAMQLPVFQDLAGALGLGTLTRTFDLTESHGRLTKGGVIHVDELQMANSDVQMEIDGRVLLNGRIDLDVTAHAGEFAATSLLGQLLRSPLRFVQPVGIGLLVQANDFFERRLLFLKLQGTIRNPTVRPRANEFLQQEAILYFLDQASSQLLR